VAGRFATRLAECDARLATYDPAAAGMTETERLSALAAAERYVRATITIPPPPSANYRLAVGVSRNTFAARLVVLRNILAMVTQSVVTLRTAVHAAVDGPPPCHSSTWNWWTREIRQGPRRHFCRPAGCAKRLIKIIEDARLTPAAALVVQHDASADPAERARLLGEAAKKLLGDDALLIPEFRLDDDQGATLQAAYNASIAGDPLTWQRTVKEDAQSGRHLAVRIARVREKIQAWSRRSCSRARSRHRTRPAASPDPWKAGEHWLGLEYPATYVA